MPSNSLLNAVLSRNATELDKLLGSGVELPSVAYRHAGAVTDLSVWTETLLGDWDEGLAVLNAHFPGVASVEQLLFSVRNGAAKCAAVLWGMFEQDLRYDTKFHDDLLKALMQGMGTLQTHPYESKNMLPMFDLVEEKGFSLGGVMVGDYEYNDFRPEGHSLWTRAWSCRKYDCVERLWPSDSVWMGWPRTNEVVFRAIEYVAGDYVMLESPHASQMQKRFLFQFFNQMGVEWISQVATEPAPDLFRLVGDSSAELVKNELWSPFGTSVVYQFSSATAITPPTILEFLFSPLKIKVSAWLRLPLVVSEQDRQVLWRLWEVLQTADRQGLLFSTLSSNPFDKHLRQLVVLLQKEAPTFFARHWYAPDQDGLRPHDRWLEFDGEEDLIEVPPLENLV